MATLTNGFAPKKVEAAPSSTSQVPRTSATSTLLRGTRKNLVMAESSSLREAPTKTSAMLKLLLIRKLHSKAQKRMSLVNVEAQ